jgi:serine phosphatase RsbU (regulator of sigma subunit)
LAEAFAHELRPGPAQHVALEDVASGSLLRAFELSPASIMVFAGPELTLVLQNSKNRAMIGPRTVGAPGRQALPEYEAYMSLVEQVWQTGRSFVSDRAPVILAPMQDGAARSVVVSSVVSPLFSDDGRVVAVIGQAVDTPDMAADDERLQVAMALDRVAIELSRSLEAADVATAVTRLAAEVFAGWSVLDLWQPDGSLARVAIAHHDAELQPLVEKLKRFPRVSGKSKSQREPFSVTAARTGEVVVSELEPGAVVAACSNADHAAVMQALCPRWIMTVPVQVGPRRLGSLSVMRSDGEQAFRPVDRAILEHYAQRAAIAVAHARDYDEQRSAAMTLQRSLLPVTPPQGDAGLEIAVRYKAGGSGSEVGGDWYDVVALGDGGLGVVVGDVEGHDLRAAALMGQVRAVVHSHAHLGLPPGRIAQEANAFVLSLGTDQLVTMTYLQLYPRERLAVMARAGHMPAIVVSVEGTAQVLRGRGGLPLGVQPEAPWLEETRQLPPGAVLALFTDGLVETVRQDFDDGVAALAALLAEHCAEPLEELADRALAETPAGRDSHDDIALLLVRLPGTLEETGLRLARRLPAASSSAPVARMFISDVLAHWGASQDVIDTAALLATELVSNAARESDSSIELRADVRGPRLRIAVSDDSHRLPQTSAMDPDGTSGRGLQLVQALSLDWGVEPEASGKAVWFELAMPG